MQITFPNKTAKQIMNECDNRLGDGKLLYDTEWYEDEDFFAKEKCRPLTAEVTDGIGHLGRTWDECSDIAKGEGGGMLNLAETLWFLLEYRRVNGAYPPDASRYSWTCSKSSDGSLVNVGGCDAYGVCVSLSVPGYSLSRLGVRFFRSAAVPGAKPGQGEADSRNLAAIRKAIGMAKAYIGEAEGLLGIEIEK